MRILRITSVILSLILAICLLSCAGGNQNNDADAPGAENNREDTTGAEIKLPDRVLLSKTVNDGSGNEYEKEVYEYDTLGNVKSLTVYTGGVKTSTTVYTYDNANRCSSITVTDHSDGDSSVEYSYIYEKNGNYVCQGPDSSTSYTVDAANGGFVAKETYPDNENFLVWEHSFDPKTLKITNETYYLINSYDQLSRSVTYKYDEYGEMSEKTEEYKNGNTSTTVYINQYDNGKLTLQSAYVDSTPHHSVMYEYNDRGELVKETLILASGLPASQTVYVYGDFQ